MASSDRRVLDSIKGVWVVVFAAGIALYGGGVNAQQTDAPAANGAAAAEQGDSGQLQQVVVTAQFRREALEAAPVSASVETADAIQARGQLDTSQIGAQAPNVTISPGGQGFGNSDSIFIRGIGQQDFNPAMEPGVGLYVDDVYYSTVFGTLFNLLDLDQIEILRGPQGTSQGMDSLGGAVLLYTAKPSARTGADAEVAIGSYNELLLRGTADIALADNLFVRFSGFSRRQDGYQTRYDYACLHPSSGLPSYATSTNCILGTLGGGDDQAVRGALRWLPSDAVEVNFSAFATREDDQTAAQTLVSTGPGAPPSEVINGQNYSLSQFVPKNIYTSYATFTDPTDGKYFDPVATTDMDGYTGTVDWKISNDLALKSITAYQEYSGQTSFDSGDSPLVVSLQKNYQSHFQFTQELRLTGNLGKALDYTVGGFYLDSNTHLNGEIDLTPGFLDFKQTDTAPLKAKAAYMTLTGHPTEKLDISAGVRYTNQVKTYNFGRLNPDGSAISPAPGAENFLLYGLDGTSATADYSHVDYRLDVDYHWTQNLMTYATLSTGFKGGGVNPRPYVASEELPFGPESLKNYEVGLKADLLDHRMIANFDIFRDNYTSIQEGTTLCPPPIPTFVPCDIIINGGKAVIEGAEAELKARIVSALSIDATGSYLDSYYTSVPAGTGLTLEDMLPYAPRFRGSLGIEYAISLKGLGVLTPRIDAIYQGALYTDSFNAPSNQLAEYTVFNGRLTWDADEHWQASLFVSNLADRRYFVNLFPASTNYLEGDPAPPREWRLSLRRSF